MLRIKTILASLCLALSSISASAELATLTVTLQYQGKPLCNWNVSLMAGTKVISEAVSDQYGVVKFPNLDVIRNNFDLEGTKQSGNSEKKWRVDNFTQYDKNVNFGEFDGTYESTNVMLNFEAPVRASNMSTGAVESSWGLLAQDNNCSGGSSNSGSSSGNKSGGGSNSELTSDIRDMRNLQQELSAGRMAELEQQKVALEEKIARLNQRVAKTRNEQAGLEAGTKTHSDKSYDLRDLELERDMAELELDRNVDERAEGGMLGKSDRQRYNEKEKEMQEEQKQLKKNRKDGVMYGESPSGAAKSKPKEEEEEDEAPFKIYTAAELANMSTYDLKRTKGSNSGSISRRKIKLKTKASFLTEDAKAKLKEQIDSLEKQIESIKAVLEKRNEAEKEEKEKEETKKE